MKTTTKDYSFVDSLPNTALESNRIVKERSIHVKTDGKANPVPMIPEAILSHYEETPADVVIVGAGPAGLSAGINAAARGRSCVILSSKISENPLYKAAHVKNMPGFPDIGGAELLEKFSDHAQKMSVPRIDGKVLSILPTDVGSSKTDPHPGFHVSFGNHFLQAKTVILAVGIPAAAGFPGEDEYLGHGVSYCATCDGMFYRGKDVAVIAKTRDAFEEALHLVKIGCRVTLFVGPADAKKWADDIPSDVFADVIYAEKYAIDGKDGLATSLLADEKKYPFSGIFILRSSVAPSKLLPELAFSGNFLVTDEKQATGIPGVFAAGDCTGAPLQIAPALGEGLIAALSADKYIGKR